MAPMTGFMAQEELDRSELACVCLPAPSLTYHVMPSTMWPSNRVLTDVVPQP